ncbi:Wzz/FepE/Etk N-terminal domain-containing protein [Chelativorans sp. YIM 93263]|uniref:Wzz/FepE/Etk N-terminal domain-containing protein n=1 Tax=Chelativorans sp. YIM 93263 TaxID=2906648 RepID=UPI0023786BE4|nr:Wzz/FepE/Etk N-terminal domain-containing protein [Chelativorans sp. YIM 93263]
MTEPLPESDNEISLLDIAAAIAQFWVLLLVVPVLVGAAAFVGLQFFQSDRYESSAILQISAGEAALLQSARVIDPAIRESGWLQRFDGRLTEARGALSRNMTVEKMNEVDYYRVSIVDRSPDAANRLLNGLVEALIASSVPRGNARAALENRLQTLERTQSELSASLNRVNEYYENATDGGSGGTVVFTSEIGSSLVALINDIASNEREIFTTRMALAGSVSESDIIQEPTLADAPMANRARMIALLAAMAAGFLTLVGVLIYSGLRNASRNPQDSEKIERIRNAFRFRKIPEPQKTS